MQLCSLATDYEIQMNYPPLRLETQIILNFNFFFLMIALQKRFAQDEK